MVMPVSYRCHRCPAVAVNSWTMAKPIIPLETRTKAIELVLDGMQQKQAARQLGVSIGAVHN